MRHSPKPAKTGQNTPKTHLDRGICADFASHVILPALCIWTPSAQPAIARIKRCPQGRLHPLNESNLHADAE
ncbi:hypothetical protein [Pseudosulfitobacter sp. DSM 107133]|jgi:hypothetical protein|uniref:hypothetical protein n=1 Tax=Pseudosulfitobacter sp. DSM 107133 TaxID=2883100 RepID=UPI000DF4B3F5|nr:hypothetical protein [Pseudosulfitobacter sp. DSM 107133]